KQILSLALKANYQQLSNKRGQIHSAIVNDVHTLIQASTNIIDFLTSVIVAMACLIYLASISLILFSITLGTAILGGIVYHLRSRKDVQNFQKARNLEDSFLENFNSILDGFKEIYMEPKKGKYIYDQKVSIIASDTYKTNVAALTGFLNNQITGQILFNILISSILLVFSITLNIKTSDTVSFIFILLYLLSSIEAIMVVLPTLARARISANHMMDLQNELEKEVFNNSIPKKAISKDKFEQLTVRNLEFYYSEKNQSFGIGPINFDIKRGETVFIYGGNGSGKTTFVHSILGLYLFSAGEIRLNDTVVNKENYPTYRTLFSVVFSDFYLFKELMGIDNFDTEKWNYYLKLFEMEDKVKIEGTYFSTTNLSTGQRKRLALIASLMEEKPILVIDEWAADQDPYFRKKFYTEIIPLLKADGVAIIAITHDDKYYHCADKLYKMEDGMLAQEIISMTEQSLVS
ncbi:MAG TPA: cyclic peptide export ABC transporter, partial [Chitinophagales bacterium]|nr:cyclic peptide export ABC transporter [Chitinophagales bacterium]